MSNKEKTVFFGPFFGELGWEASFWHGWVRKMCREKYQSYKKIAASYPGRKPLYPDIDEFWPHPPEITELKISQHGYISDFWMENLPEGTNQANFDKNISQYAEDLLCKYQKRLPAEAIFYVPHRLNIYELNGKQNLFGVLILRKFKIIKTFSISFKDQLFEILEPTVDGKKILRKLVSPKKRIIAIFPRCRLGRRPDKNWPRKKYDLLIKNLQKYYPKHLIAICGTLGGVYYTQGVPANCLNLINLPGEIRLSVQLAALKQADLALGSVSGAFRIVLLAGCPVVEWGYNVYKKDAIDKQNFLKTRIIYWPEINPSVETIENLIELMMKKREREVIYPEVLEESWIPVEPTTFIIKKINFIKVVLKKIISRIFLIYLKRKKLNEGVINNQYGN